MKSFSSNYFVLNGSPILHSITCTISEKKTQAVFISPIALEMTPRKNYHWHTTITDGTYFTLLVDFDVFEVMKLIILSQILSVFPFGRSTVQQHEQQQWHVQLSPGNLNSEVHGYCLTPRMPEMEIHLDAGET